MISVLFAEIEKLQSMDLFGTQMHVLLSQFMHKWHGKVICEWLAIVLFGAELVENYTTLMSDLNLWNFLFKMLVFGVGIHSAHSVFLKMSIWSRSGWPAVNNNRKGSLQHPIQRWWKGLKPAEDESYSVQKIAQRFLLNQLPLQFMIALAVFHSISGSYLFYKLTGFARQNIIHREESGLYIAYVYLVDAITILTVLLWFRWTMVFYSHEANEMQHKIKQWSKIFDNRWHYIAWCTVTLGFVLLSLAFLKLFKQVPYLKTEAIPTTLLASTWFYRTFLVTIVTFFSCFPHGVCQILSTLLTLVGFCYVSASEVEIKSEVYGVVYFLMPSAMAVAALGYHACFSPVGRKGVELGKVASEVLTALLVFMMVAVVHNEIKAFNLYTIYPFQQ